MVLEIIDNPEDKQCKAITAKGNRCAYHGCLDGYCATHFNKKSVEKKVK